MKIAVLFPGQGSQFLGMGQKFMETSGECREIMSITEDVCGVDMARLCNEGPMEELTQAIYLQPAITAINLMCWTQLSKNSDIKSRIEIVAGHSLGEYSALHAAGVVSLRDTLRLVAKRGALMWREGEKNPGGMRAILGLDIEEVDSLIASVNGQGVVTTANHNTEQQIVVSGNTLGLDTITDKAEQKGAKVIPLNVSIANHSPLVEGAVPDFSEFMDEIDFESPAIDVVFNVTGKKQDNPQMIKDMMSRQIASRVCWYDSILKMLDEGVEIFIEAGPKSVLKGMMRKIVPKGVKYTAMQFDTPEGLEKCLAQLN